MLGVAPTLSGIARRSAVLRRKRLLLTLDPEHEAQDRSGTSV
jgi:hypothetical protein